MARWEIIGLRRSAIGMCMVAVISPDPQGLTLESLRNSKNWFRSLHFINPIMSRQLEPLPAIDRICRKWHASIHHFIELYPL
jgi:hypothetical protein